MFVGRRADKRADEHHAVHDDGNAGPNRAARKGLIFCIAAGNNNARSRTCQYENLSFSHVNGIKTYSGPIDRWVPAHRT